MAKIVCVANQKGGVAKTTTSINLSAALIPQGYRVLLIDLDPQGNATVGCGVNGEDTKATVYELVIQTAAIRDCIVTTSSGIDLLPANADLSGALVELLNEIGRELRLKQALEEVESDYDYIFIDCPPALNILTINALVAADSVLIPMQCEYFALEGLSALVSTIKKIKAALNPELKIEGLLRTMFDKRNALSREVSNQLEKHFGDKVYDVIIPRNIRLAEAPSHGQPGTIYAPSSKGARAYRLLAKEVQARAQLLHESSKTASL